MQARHRVLAIVAVAAALAGCGSSKKPTQTATTASPAKIDPAFIARVNAVCAAASKGATPFPYRNFNPIQPDVKLLPKVGAFFAKRQKIADAVPGQLRHLGHPASGQSTWARMLVLTARDRAIADRQIKAAEASDARAFVATVTEVSGVSSQLAQLARAAGFSSSSPCQMIF
jgi:hypothetical protein